MNSFLKCQPRKYFLVLKRSGFVNVKVPGSVKRGNLLSRMVSPEKDKKKHWHLKIMNTTSKSKNIFENVHRPSRRTNVLNSLFIKNITDVLSTGDVTPEIMGYGIEITGVKISPCWKILNVYWHTPAHYFKFCEDIEEMLNINSFKLRSELISRNVLGKVPKIFFIRDHTNARAAAFEEALTRADFGPDRDSPIIPDDEFAKDILVFKTAKVKKKEIESPAVVFENKEHNLMPPKPADMKCDVFGLKHDDLMDRVLALKKKPKLPEQQLNIASPNSSENSDLFSKIPGSTLDSYSNSERKLLLKQFQVERKLMMKRKKELYYDEVHLQNVSTEVSEIPDNFIEDYYVEETDDKP